MEGDLPLSAGQRNPQRVPHIPPPPQSIANYFLKPGSQAPIGQRKEEVKRITFLGPRRGLRPTGTEEGGAHLSFEGALCPSTHTRPSLHQGVLDLGTGGSPQRQLLISSTEWSLPVPGQGMKPPRTGTNRVGAELGDGVGCA